MTIPINNTTNEICPICHMDYTNNDTDEFRMRVSKEYLQKATHAYLYENMYNIEKFEANLAKIGHLYHYDKEVVNCIQHVKNLRADILDIIKKNASLPIEKMLLLIEEAVRKSPVNENSKQTVSSIIREVLFSRGALRTLNEETDRWKKEPIERWPATIKNEGIRYLDKKGSVKRLNAEDFIAWVHSNHRAEEILEVADQIYNSAKPIAITAVVGLIAKTIFSII